MRVSSDSVISGDLELLVVLEKVMNYVKVYVPIDDNDKEFRKEYFKTSIDISRLLKGVQGNFLVQVFMENFLTALSPIPSFPMKKVSLNTLFINFLCKSALLGKLHIAGFQTFR